VGTYSGTEAPGFGAGIWHASVVASGNAALHDVEMATIANMHLLRLYLALLHASYHRACFVQHEGHTEVIDDQLVAGPWKAVIVIPSAVRSEHG
jgi:hypothetical protein